MRKILITFTLIITLPFIGLSQWKLGAGYTLVYFPNNFLVHNQITEKPSNNNLGQNFDLILGHQLKRSNINLSIGFAFFDKQIDPIVIKDETNQELGRANKENSRFISFTLMYAYAVVESKRSTFKIGIGPSLLFLYESSLVFSFSDGTTEKLDLAKDYNELIGIRLEPAYTFYLSKKIKSSGFSLSASLPFSMYYKDEMFTDPDYTLGLKLSLIYAF